MDPKDFLLIPRIYDFQFCKRKSDVFAPVARVPALSYLL